MVIFLTIVHGHRVRISCAGRCLLQRGKAADWPERLAEGIAPRTAFGPRGLGDDASQMERSPREALYGGRVVALDHSTEPEGSSPALWIRKSPAATQTQPRRNQDKGIR